MKATLEVVILPVSDPDRSLHKNTDGGWRGGFVPGLDPDRADYARLADFRDPDGNAWVLQERGHQSARIRY